ncbi:MAG: M23 family metallopeptidase [Pseudomonadota bacterium]
MRTLFKRQVNQVAAAILATATLTVANPALANTSTNNATTAADVTASIKDAQAETLTTGDAKFRDLFASWVALDKGGPEAPVERTVVSIPSRMPLNRGRISSGYGMRVHPVLRKRRNHKGIDLAAPTGTPVYATADGMITRANRFSSYVLYISIDHGANLETRYAHLSRIAVAKDQRVRKGDLIGYVGSTGRSTGPHLHYEVRVGGVAVNPIPYMKETQAQTAYANDARLTGQGG